MRKKLCALALALCLLLSLPGCGMPFGLGVHEVRFELNGGTLVSGELLQKVKTGESAEAPSVEREGYVFAGWSKDLDDVRENMVAVAQWTRLYTVTFDPNGGELVSGELEQQVAEGALPQEPTLERQYAAFDGWSPAITEATGDTVYTAQWTHAVLSPEALYEYISPAVVELQVYDRNGTRFALGSGFFIDEEGTLVTNFHVIDAAWSAEAILSDGSRAEILAVKAYDAKLDLAILQADVAKSQRLVFAEQGVKTGETVYALGSSQGLTGSFSEGIVSTASREIDGVNCVQTTAPISSGNSGGPLVNRYGEAVGVNSMTLELGQNLNFAIDIRELDKLETIEPLTLAELYEETVPEAVSAERTGGWYDVKGIDYYEEESNDSLLLADSLENDAWIVGDVSDIEDLDCFALLLEEESTVTFMAAPYLRTELEDFTAAVLCMGEEDLELVARLEPFEAPEGEFLHHVSFGKAAEVTLQPGVYFLCCYVEDAYWAAPDAEPINYLVIAEW